MRSQPPITMRSLRAVAALSWRKSVALGTLSALLVACTENVTETGGWATAPASFVHDLSSVRGQDVGAIEPWPTEHVSYAIESLHPSLDEAMFRAEVRAALDEWSRVIDERRMFYEVDDPRSAQLVIGFRTSAHDVTLAGCPDKFTQGVRTIAHVFTYESECLAGIVHLNSDLTWVMDGSNRKGNYDVRYAILHEVGHLLGLEHTYEPGHIMFPEYIGVVRKLRNEEGQDVLDLLDGGGT